MAVQKPSPYPNSALIKQSLEHWLFRDAGVRRGEPGRKCALVFGTGDSLQGAPRCRGVGSIQAMTGRQLRGRGSLPCTLKVGGTGWRVICWMCAVAMTVATGKPTVYMLLFLRHISVSEWAPRHRQRSRRGLEPLPQMSRWSLMRDVTWASSPLLGALGSLSLK